ncbi:MAG: hypothetical protein NVS2B16_34890 [Chloroflexota bacterium]
MFRNLFNKGWVASLLVLAAGGARASDCAVVAPSYVAERTVTVGDASFRTQVYASGDREREDARLDGQTRITIRTPTGTTIFEPGLHRGVEMPIPDAPRQQTRPIDSVEADGTRLRIIQFQRGESWIELSRTTCRNDGVMIRRDFVTIDGQGRELKGYLIQDHIRLGSVPPETFNIPADITLQKRR